MQEATAQALPAILQPKPTKSERVRELIEAGCQTGQVIAKTVGCDPALVSRILKEYKLEANQITEYKSQRAEILAGIQAKILKQLNPDDIKISNAKELKDALTGFGIAMDKERLERGQSTSNHAHLHKMSEDTAEMLSRITGQSGAESTLAPELTDLNTGKVDT